MTEQWAQLPFDEAIAYFAGKTAIDTDDYLDGMGVVQDVAFTVAKAKGDLLVEIRSAVEKSIANGHSIESFQQAFNRIADRWSPDWLGNGDRAWRSQLIYETNLRSAYAAGRYTQMTEPDVLEKRPYWQWRHGGSARPRPHHVALDGKVFTADQLFFQTGGFPPCGFGCRCKVYSMSPADLSKRGLLVSEPPDVGTIVDKGWGFVPGKTDRSELLAGLPDDIRKLVLTDPTVKFAERVDLLTADYASRKKGKGKKNCEKGKICKGSCISKRKTCLGDMNPAQVKLYKASQKIAKASKGGGGGTQPDSSELHSIASLKDTENPSDKDIKKLEDEYFLKKIAFEQLDQSDNSRWKSPEYKALSDATFYLEQAQSKRDYYVQHKKLHEIIADGKATIDKELLKSLNAKPSKTQLDRLEKAQKDFDKISDTDGDSFNTKEWRELIEAKDAIKAIESSRVEAMQRFRSGMMKMSREEANVYADRISIHKGPDASLIRDSIADVYMIIGPRDLGVEEIKKTDRRAYAKRSSKYINSGIWLGDEDLKATMYHELGHFIEWQKNAVPLNEHWVKARGTGPAARMQSYEPNEIAIPDHFMDQYVGKTYPNSTEVFSMGLQQFHSPSAMLDLYKSDREHFFLMLGAIKNDKI